MTQHVSTLRAGGQVTAIIPQSIEDVWRVSKAVVRSGLAPRALTLNKEADEATSAVAVAIMAGAELGLKPMTSLRSFTAINGRLALYGDGLIAVVRQSGRCASIESGHDDRGGFRRAERSDTGEHKETTFTLEDARRAGLCDERSTVRRMNEKGEWYDAPNDGAWFKHPKRMLEKRAVAFCLRDLFADVLGGVRDEFEARDVPAVVLTEDENTGLATPMPPSPPPLPPSAAAEPEETGDEGERSPFDLEALLCELEDDLAVANSKETVEEAWDQYEAERQFGSDDNTLRRALEMKRARLASLATTVS